MHQLAMKYQITIVWFYDEPGYGKGIVDSMSSFGCKQPLRKAIIDKDMWFEFASDMLDYLTNHFSDDLSKNHYLIDAETLADIRRNPKGFKIPKQCRKMHIIAFNKEGEFCKQLYFHDTNIVTKLFSPNINNNADQIYNQ